MQRFNLAIVFAIFLSCSSNETKVVTNKEGNYSVTVLHDWKYRIEKKNTRIEKTIKIGTQYVSGTLTISEGPTEYNTLDETASIYLSQFPSTFTDFRKISEGSTEINGIRCRWFRMTDNDNGTTYMTVQYILQQKEKVCYILNCSATEDMFRDFEEDFTRMVFSYKRHE